MRWFDRKFSFDLAPWMYPNIVERLRGTPARVEEMTGALSQGTLTHRAHGAWSIQENIGHLLDLEALWYGRVEDFDAGVDVLRPADLENRLTHEGNHNEHVLDEILSSFRSQRKRLVIRLDEADQEFVEKVAQHPRLEQPMRMIDLVFFVAEHDDHHLATINVLIRMLGPGRDPSV